MCTPTYRFTPFDGVRTNITAKTDSEKEFASLLAGKGITFSNCTYAKLADESPFYSALSKFVVKNAKGTQSLEITPSSKNRGEKSKRNFWLFNGGKAAGKERKTDTDRTKKTSLGMGLGLHEVEFEDTKVFVLEQEIGDPVSPGSCRYSPMIYKSTVILVDGTGKAEFLHRFMEHVIQCGTAKTKDSIIEVFQFAPEYRQWTNVVSKHARPLESVFLPRAVQTQLVQDMENYLSQDAVGWYQHHGIPYKRTYLFYGPPGCGKTSLIQALAGHFSMNVCFLQPTGPKFSDHAFQKAIRSAPENSMIVIEDIDSLFDKNRQKKVTESSPLTFSGLLNSLDGIANPDGQVFILTTNHIDRLDPALIRNGRVDLHIEFPLAKAEQMQRMFRSFYPCLEPFKRGVFKTKEDEEEEEEEVKDGVYLVISNKENTAPKKHLKPTSNGLTNGHINALPNAHSNGHSHDLPLPVLEKASKTPAKPQLNDPEIPEIDEEKRLEELSKQFSAAWLKRFPKSVPMAAIQQHFISHMRSSAEECVAAVPVEKIFVPDFGDEAPSMFQ